MGLGSNPSSKDSNKKKDTKVNVLIAHDHANFARPAHTNTSDWVVDSGASSHICANRDWFSFYSTLQSPRPIVLGDHRSVNPIGQGQIKVIVHHGSSTRQAVINNILHCPQIGTNLLSVTQLISLGSKVRFFENKCEIRNPYNEVVAVAHSINGLFKLPCTIAAAEKAYITKSSGFDHNPHVAFVA